MLTVTVAIMAVFTLAVCFIMLGSTSVELMNRLCTDENQFGTGRAQARWLFEQRQDSAAELADCRCHCHSATYYTDSHGHGR